MATIANLANGQLPATKQTLYTCPVGKSAVVLGIDLVNTDSGSRVVNLYYKKSGGTSRRISPKDMSMAANFYFPRTGKITMAAGDVIEGDADSANLVDYVINGVEI